MFAKVEGTYHVCFLRAFGAPRLVNQSMFPFQHGQHACLYGATFESTAYLGLLPVIRHIYFLKVFVHKTLVYYMNVCFGLPMDFDAGR